MEKPLKTGRQLSLKQITMNNAVGLLWNEPDILATISQYKFTVSQLSGGRKLWRENIEDKVYKKISKLPIPESLKAQMCDKVKPMGLEVRHWKIDNESFNKYAINEFSLPDSEKLHWTAAGLLDYSKTAGELMRSRKFRADQLYKIACTYCLEDWIRLVWARLPEFKKEMYSSENRQSSDLIYCWPHILKGDFTKLDNLVRRMNGDQIPFNQFAFQRAVEHGNEAAAAYFWGKLTEVERKDSLMRTVLNVLRSHLGEVGQFTKHSNILCYLFSFMTPEQQVEIVKAHPAKVLLSFLDWPLHDLFLENAAFIWDFLPPSEYAYVLFRMAHKFKDHYVPGLFQRFFIQSPNGFKSYFANEGLNLEDPPTFILMSIFIESGDSDSMIVIFRNVDAANRLRLVFHRRFFKIIFNCFLKGKCYIVEECLRETRLSKEDKQRMKVEFREYLETLVGLAQYSQNHGSCAIKLKNSKKFKIETPVSGGCVNQKFRSFFEFLDEGDNDSKENLEALA